MGYRTNIRLGSKCLLAANTLAYLDGASNTK
jgi:hypothetical protein